MKLFKISAKSAMCFSEIQSYSNLQFNNIINNIIKKIKKYIKFL